MKRVKQFSYKLFTGNHFGKFIFNKTANMLFPGSAAYWEKRYRKNGNSGAGSFGEKALYKAAFLNRFVEERSLNSVTELGCGDGQQAVYFRFPIYTGLDISATAIGKCRDRFRDDSSKSFFVSGGQILTSEWQAELTLSLDVVYHLVEDSIYESYIYSLFSLATRYVIVYAWDVDQERKYHVRHRNFSKWINNHIPDFRLIKKVSKDSCCDFFVYERVKISD